MTIEQRNNAIAAFMGGPAYLKEKHFSHLTDSDFERLVKLEDLKFDTSWDWMIPVWSKLRFEMTPTMVFAAIQFTDTADLSGMHQLVSNVCINWCTKQGINL
jgi:hypothetical protein